MSELIDELMGGWISLFNSLLDGFMDCLLNECMHGQMKEGVSMWENY